MVTILDLFNEDCWRLVLDLLPTEDIIRSERVSRGWQDVIFRYLQDVGICIEYPWYSHKASRSQRTLKMVDDNPVEFKELTRKWGLCIKKADCINEECLDVIRKNCPNLEEITFYGLQDDALSSGSAKNLKKLKRVHFRGCDSVRLYHYLNTSNKKCFAFCGLYCYILKAYFGYTCCVYKNQLTDKCVKHWLVNYNIEDLAVSGAEELTGTCLSTPLSAKLMGLCFIECEALELRHLLSATKHLKHLKKLELIHLPRGIFQNIHSLLDQLPDLENLCLRWEKKMELGYDWAESIGRLRLRQLDVSFNPNVNDEWLAKASSGFGRLNELLLEGCLGVTGRGAKAACRVAGPALRILHLGCNVKICDADIEEIVRTCPNLMCVDLSFTQGMTNNVVERVANARSVRDRKLRLIVESTDVKDDGGRFPWLVVDFGE